MATIVSTLFISLDGVVEIDPAWHFPYFDEHMGAAVGDDYEGADALLLGRVTYGCCARRPSRPASSGSSTRRALSPARRSTRTSPTSCRGRATTDHAGARRSHPGQV